jgi:STE24 endopeptidase
MTINTFIKDLVKSFILTLIFQAIIVYPILWVIQTCGDNLIFYLSVLVISLILLMQIIVPIFIMPLFYALKELEDGDLKTAIYKEAEKTKVNVSQIKVIDGSTRSSHSNAFVIGFSFFRKVVIFDTLIEQ